MRTKIATKKLKSDKIRPCNQIFEKESAIRKREIQIAKREEKRGPLSIEEFDAEVEREHRSGTKEDRIDRQNG